MTEAGVDAAAPVPRRRQILEALARELESRPGARVTTARLAEVVGVSEAALYRHFSSKARMFEALIEFAEESVFGTLGRIVREEPAPIERVAYCTRVLLMFSERNPGITRVLLGDALVGENDALRRRVDQLFERVETQLRQILREGGSDWVSGTVAESATVNALAALLLGVIEGRMRRYVRSGFARRPLEGWEAQWSMLRLLFEGRGGG